MKIYITHILIIIIIIIIINNINAKIQTIF